MDTSQLFIADLTGNETGPATLQDAATLVGGVHGVESVAYSRSLPLVSENLVPIQVGNSSAVYALVDVVSSDYFQLMGIPVVRGRPFGPDDQNSSLAKRPTLISRHLANRLWGREDVIGETVSVAGEPIVLLEVVGVVRDRLTGTGATSMVADGSVLYELADPQLKSGFLFLRIPGGTAVLGKLREQLREITGVGVAVESFQSRINQRMVLATRLTGSLTFLAVVSLVLSLVGLAGMASSNIHHRSRELAIRLALGAPPAAVRRMLVFSGLKVTSIGVGIGMAIAWGVLRLIELLRVVPLRILAGNLLPYGAAIGILIFSALGIFLAATRSVGKSRALSTLRD